MFVIGWLVWRLWHSCFNIVVSQQLTNMTVWDDMLMFLNPRAKQITDWRVPDAISSLSIKQISHSAPDILYRLLAYGARQIRHENNDRYGGWGELRLQRPDAGSSNHRISGQWCSRQRNLGWRYSGRARVGKAMFRRGPAEVPEVFWQGQGLP